MTIHVDYNPDHSAMTFADTNGEPILTYRSGNGWVLNTNDAEEYIICADIGDVDSAVATAKELLQHREWLQHGAEEGEP